MRCGDSSVDFSFTTQPNLEFLPSMDAEFCVEEAREIVKENETGLQDNEQTFFVTNNREIVAPHLMISRVSSKENRFKKQVIDLMVQRDKPNPSCLSLLNFSMIPLARRKAGVEIGGFTTQDNYPDRVSRYSRREVSKQINWIDF